MVLFDSSPLIRLKTPQLVLPYPSELKILYFIGLVFLFMRDLPIFNFRLINPQELDSQVVSMSTMKMVSKKIFMDFCRNFTNSYHNTRTILCTLQVKNILNDYLQLVVIFSMNQSHISLNFQPIRLLLKRKIR